MYAPGPWSWPSISPVRVGWTPTVQNNLSAQQRRISKKHWHCSKHKCIHTANSLCSLWAKPLQMKGTCWVAAHPAEPPVCAQHGIYWRCHKHTSTWMCLQARPCSAPTVPSNPAGVGRPLPPPLRDGLFAQQTSFEHCRRTRWVKSPATNIVWPPKIPLKFADGGVGSGLALQSRCGVVHYYLAAEPSRHGSTA